MNDYLDQDTLAPATAAPPPAAPHHAPRAPQSGRFSLLIWLIIVKSAFKSLVANKLRSVLAMLGIIIGVGAVIAMLAMGAGAQQQILARVTAMGTNLLVVRPGQSAGGAGVKSGTQINLTLSDAKALAVDTPHLVALAPVVGGGNAQVKFFNHNARTSVTGTAPTYLSIRDFQVERGRAFTDIEADGDFRVAIIGPVTATNLFEDEDPLDQQIKINGINFRVIGVLKAKGDSGWFNPDDQVLIPYTTAMHQLFGQLFNRDTLREIDLQADDSANLPALQEAVTAKLRKLHKLEPTAADDFEIRNQADFLDAANQMAFTFQLLLGSIASISLLVGGIGIMNIMLVTVTERTREIGIRKAIGAKDRDILTQFLVESLIMSALGGILGACLGIGMAKGIPLIPVFKNFSTIVSPVAVVAAVTVAGAVGIFFGVYPAWKASRLDPIEALRYE